MPSNHQRLLADVATRTRSTVEALYGRWKTGDLSLGEFQRLAAAAVATGNREASVVADVGVAALLTQMRDQPVGPVGVDLPDWVLDEVRLTESFGTALEDKDTAEGRVGLIGRSEPVAVGALAMAAVLLFHKSRWVRVTDADPCPLCSRWADGVARPAEMPMNRHTGCTCLQQPVS